MNPKHTEKLRQKYIANPPEGMTPEDIQGMSEEALLDMDYFLHEDDFEDDGVGEIRFGGRLRAFFIALSYSSSRETRLWL